MMSCSIPVQLMVANDFHSIFFLLYNWSQWLPWTVWLPTYFKISSSFLLFLTEERKSYIFETIWGWVNNEWYELDFRVNYHFKLVIFGIWFHCSVYTIWGLRVYFPCQQLFRSPFDFCCGLCIEAPKAKVIHLLLEATCVEGWFCSM